MDRSHCEQSVVSHFVLDQRERSGSYVRVDLVGLFLVEAVADGVEFLGHW